MVILHVNEVIKVNMEFFTFNEMAVPQVGYSDIFRYT